MIRKYLFLSAVVLAGTYIGLTPAWSADSKSNSSSDQGSMGQSSGTSSTDSQSGSSSMAGMSRRSGSRAAGQGNIKQIQEALKDKGFDPGPIDGVMGQKTQEALRSFQQSKNLKVTGRVDSETARELGASSSSAGVSGASGSESSTGGSSSSQSSNTGMSGSSSGTSSESGSAAGNNKFGTTIGPGSTDRDSNPSGMGSSSSVPDVKK